MRDLARLALIFNGDETKIRRHLEVNARLTLLRYAPAPPKPAAGLAGYTAWLADAEREHRAALLAAGLIDEHGRRISHDEHGRRIYLDPGPNGGWYWLDHHGTRHYLTDDD
jgi:hypothetical protein